MPQLGMAQYQQTGKGPRLSPVGMAARNSGRSPGECWETRAAGCSHNRGAGYLITKALRQPGAGGCRCSSLCLPLQGHILRSSTALAPNQSDSESLPGSLCLCFCDCQSECIADVVFLRKHSGSGAGREPGRKNLAPASWSHPGVTGQPLETEGWVDDRLGLPLPVWVWGDSESLSLDHPVTSPYSGSECGLHRAESGWATPLACLLSCTGITKPLVFLEGLRLCPWSGGGSRRSHD